MQPLAVADPYQAIRITARLGFNARGEPLGSPQFTYVTPNVTDQIKNEYKRAVSELTHAMHAFTVLFRTRSDDRRSASNSALRRTRADAGQGRAGHRLMLPRLRYRPPKFLQHSQSPRCCSRQCARRHQSGCPVLLVPFKACRTGQKPHRTGVPVVCSSPDYTACHSQTFRQLMGLCSQ